MQYEVELKFRVPDFERLGRMLAERGVEFSSPQEQADSYFAHPQRDFAVTDEAFRIRQSGAENRVTYKGPKIDRTTKTRREIELALPPGKPYALQFSELLTALGFRLVAVVEKRRRTGGIAWQNHQVEVCLDQVEGVGAFAELEVLADQEELEEAKAVVTSLAAELHLTETERRSYLELLLENSC